MTISYRKLSQTSHCLRLLYIRVSLINWSSFCETHGRALIKAASDVCTVRIARLTISSPFSYTSFLSRNEKIFVVQCNKIKMDRKPGNKQKDNPVGFTGEGKPFPGEPYWIFFCFFPGFLAIFILLSSNNNNIPLFVSCQIRNMVLVTLFYLFKNWMKFSLGKQLWKQGYIFILFRFATSIDVIRATKWTILYIDCRCKH